uniref:Uncharacterized protein n=1 Tax=Romanomermis culicivorax TaxID=13658 RepID=A0A915KMN5_ROMCU
MDNSPPVGQRVNCPNVVLGSIVQMNAIAAQTVVPAVQLIKRVTPASPQEQHLLDTYPKTAPFHIEEQDDNPQQLATMDIRDARAAKSKFLRGHDHECHRIYDLYCQSMSAKDWPLKSLGASEKEPEFNLADPKENELPKGLIRDDLMALLQRKDEKKKWEKAHQTTNKLREASGRTPTTMLNSESCKKGKITDSFSSMEMPRSHWKTNLEPQIKSRGDYNVKSIIQIHELDQWFKGTFAYWLANPKEPVLVDMGKDEAYKASRLRHWDWSTL